MAAPRKANPKIKKFQTALTDEARRGEEKEVVGEPITVMIDDDEYTVSPPTTTAFAVLASMFQSGDDGMVFATALNLFLPLIEDETQRRRLGKRLFDPKDGIEIDVLSEVITYCLEEWTGFPTKSSSVS